MVVFFFFFLVLFFLPVAKKRSRLKGSSGFGADLSAGLPLSS